MRIILNSLFFVIVVLNGRFFNKVFASDKSSSETVLYESLGEVVKNGQKSVLTVSNRLEIDSNVLKETEKQELLLPSQSVVGDSPILDKLEVSSELSTTAEAVVFPSADTAVELQNRVKTQFQHEKANNSSQIFNSFQRENEEYVVHAEPKIQVQTIAEETLKRDTNESESVPQSSQEETKKTAPQHEDIPSFSEWTQKQLAEAEKKKTDQNETTDKFTKTRGKFRNKNYASPDCGAKIVAANPESVSSSSVLSSLKDEYMLNYCTNRIWFVVELCEAIQAKQLDLANFELFSSSPKHFSVHVSHRFPTRDWSAVGKFTAQDSRDVQTFNLHPHLFGKYVKVELLSHYGREQFCPISWVGVYGTSEYEVLAKEDERHSVPEEDDQFDEDIFVGQRKDSPKNLFSSATDAVLSIVKKATAPFMKTDNNETESESSEKSPESTGALCVSPRYITVCNNCSQSFYDEVFQILSCQHSALDQLIANPFVKRTLINSEACTKFGLDFNGLRTGAPYPCNYLENPREKVNYLTLMLKSSVLAGLCNVLAVSENKVVVNSTVDADQTLKNVTREACEVSPSKSGPTASPASPGEGDCSTQSRFHQTKSSVFTEIFKSSEKFSKKIEPTKTLTEDEVKMLPPSEMYPERSVEVLEEKSTELPSSGHVTSTATVKVKVGKDRIEVESSVQKEPKVSFVDGSKAEAEKEPVAEDRAVNGTNHDSTLESIISDLNAIERAGNFHSSAVAPSTANLPAESIFLRLANRIKNLEINMSLSSTYLEELSKRYRVQLELLSKTLNLTIQKIEEQTRAEEEKERKREKEISILRNQLANLTRDMSILVREKNSWSPGASSIGHHLFIFFEIFLVWTVFTYWKRSVQNKSAGEGLEIPKRVTKKYKRRNSLEGVKGHETPRRKMRRPSDEALEIALARNHAEDLLKMDKKRKRRKKDSKCSIHLGRSVDLKRKSDTTAPCVAIEKEPPSVVSEETQVPESVPSRVSSAGEIEITNRFAIISSPKSERSNSVSKAFQGLSSSPIFMKTALAARNSRLRLASDKESSQEQSEFVRWIEEAAKKEAQKERKGANSLKKYMKKFF